MISNHPVKSPCRCLTTTSNTTHANTQSCPPLWFSLPSIQVYSPVSYLCHLPIVTQEHQLLTSPFLPSPPPVVPDSPETTDASSLMRSPAYTSRPFISPLPTQNNISPVFSHRQTQKSLSSASSLANHAFCALRSLATSSASTHTCQGTFPMPPFTVTDTNVCIYCQTS